ncbi:hypothetical protein Taro_029497 [Colocasia esculenta]|uniref:Uncharacterized protein n=1 Tax=Colocasia esculenta TaxID=4460 RepID=A0A843VJZ4_COLES|nr:hypothetical protein [Colocasia esculenta]
MRMPSVVVQRLFRNASLVGYPRFFVSQARVFVVLGVCPGTVWYRRVPHFKELGSESLKEPSMELQPCELQLR